MAKLYVSNRDESARIFKSGILEFFTHVHWSVPIIVYIPLVIFLLYRAVTDGGLSTSSLAGTFLAGVFVWTFAEYLLHRFIFHYEPKSEWGKRLHFLMHGVHHDYPNDSKRLVMPPSMGLPLAFIFYLVFSLVIPAPALWVFFAGFIFGYVWYDEVHYASHHAPLKGKIGLWIKHHHIRHHYLNPGRGYGVSSPLWDYVFGTMEDEKEQVSLETKEA